MATTSSFPALKVCRYRWIVTICMRTGHRWLRLLTRLWRPTKTTEATDRQLFTQISINLQRLLRDLPQQSSQIFLEYVRRLSLLLILFNCKCLTYPFLTTGLLCIVDRLHVKCLIDFSRLASTEYAL